MKTRVSLKYFANALSHAIQNILIAALSKVNFLKTDFYFSSSISYTYTTHGKQFFIQGSQNKQAHSTKACTKYTIKAL